MNLEEGVCFECGYHGECVWIVTQPSTPGTPVMWLCRACAEKAAAMFPIRGESEMKETCENCRFQVESECRRYPRGAVRMNKYWCGKWKAIVAAETVGDGYCHRCGHGLLAAQNGNLKSQVEKLQAVIRFALDKCVSRTAGNLDNPFAYLWQQDWDDFAALALKAGVSLLKQEEGSRGLIHSRTAPVVDASLPECDGEVCDRCGQPGQDRRTIWMTCGAVMNNPDDPTTPDVPYQEVAVQLPEGILRKTRFKTLRVCKQCRADWITAIGQWFTWRSENHG